MKRYPEYQLFEGNWLSSIPATWKQFRGKILFHDIDKRSETGEEELLTVSHITGVTPRKEKNVTMFKAESLEGYKLCEVGDFASNTMWMWMGAIGVSKYSGLVSPSYNVYRQKNSDYLSEYLEYLLREPNLVAEYRRHSTGVRPSRLRLYPDKFLNIVFPLPSLGEQKAIADFLDKKTEQIDRFISLQKEAISLLKELRQAEITKAVTKGLDENAEMKDSGVEWIGEIPEKWGVIPLKYLCDMHAGKSLSSEKILDEGKYSVYGGNGLRGFYTEYNTSGNVLLVGRQGALCGNVHRVCGDFWATEHAVVTNCSSLTDRDYLYYLLIGMNLNQYSSDAAAQPGLSVADIINVRTCFVPLHEQKEIASYLDQKCAEIDSAIQNKEALIEKVTEYKTRLISDAVTGNIDVRGEDIKPEL